MLETGVHHLVAQDLGRHPRMEVEDVIDPEVSVMKEDQEMSVPKMAM
jgi:hypothetical protein